MGLNLQALPISILLGFFVAAGMFTAFGDISIQYDDNMQKNAPFGFNRTLTTAEKITGDIEEQGSEGGENFFPNLKGLWNTYFLLKDAIADLGQAMETYTVALGGGKLVVTLKTIITVVGIAFAAIMIILLILFKVTSAKENS